MDGTMHPEDGPLYGPALMAAHRLAVARKLVSAHDEAERLHAAATAMPRGQERDRALDVSSRALSREANLAREYAHLIGRPALSWREPGESRADYQSARSSYDGERLREALAHARSAIAAA